MTLRLRLVLALAALVAVGLAVFGAATYFLYAQSEYDRLDDQLRAAVPSISIALWEQAGLGDPDQDHDQSGRDEGPPVVAPPGTYGELRSPEGLVLAVVQVYDQSSTPDLPDDLTPPAQGAVLFDTGSATGSGDWRVRVSADPRGNTVIVAVPRNDLEDALHRLVLIEATAAGVLLLLLVTGSWLVLRRGLRPLERMADTAESITAGDLSPRVEPADERSEVGRLGLALNTMLDDLQVSFEEREATERRLRQFLADASHELRTPLTAIRGFAELSRLDADREHVDQAVIARRIEEESDRMAALVEDLLLLARLDQTRPPEREPVDLAVLAADACSDAVAVAPDRPVTLDAPDPVVVSGDRDHLRQAIANLVSNAVRHTPEGTPLEVSAVVDDGSGVVVVRDHGPGLGDEALGHAFDRFWQADEARVGTGAGLGLSIVAAIAAEHGGQATGANADGGGARFELRLPLDRA